MLWWSAKPGGASETTQGPYRIPRQLFDHRQFLNKRVQLYRPVPVMYLAPFEGGVGIRLELAQRLHGIPGRLLHRAEFANEDIVVTIDISKRVTHKLRRSEHGREVCLNRLYHGRGEMIQ